MFAGPLVSSRSSAARSVSWRRAWALAVPAPLRGAWYRQRDLAAAVIVRHARVAAADGARINLVAAAVPRGLGGGAAPDATVTYAEVDGRHVEINISQPGGQWSLAPVVMSTRGGGWILGRAEHAVGVFVGSRTADTLRSCGFRLAAPQHRHMEHGGLTGRLFAGMDRQPRCGLRWRS